MDEDSVFKAWAILATVVSSILIAVILVASDWLNSARVTAAATLLTAAGIFVALYGLADARRTRHAQIVTDLSERWDSEESAESQRAFLLQGSDAVGALFRRLYDPPQSRTLREFGSDLRLQTALLRWPNLLETIGVLHSTGIVSTDVVYRMWGAGVVSWWRSWEAIADELREFDKERPGIFRHFQKLNDDMEKHAASIGEPFPPRSV
jgi:hypothetical protein